MAVGYLLERIRRGLPYDKPERVVLAPDCGMKYLSRDVVFQKTAAMVEAATRLRS